MSAVQVMRQRAYAAGTLRTSAQLNVVYQPSAIAHSAVNPAVIYVPLYNPVVVDWCACSVFIPHFLCAATSPGWSCSCCRDWVHRRCRGWGVPFLWRGCSHWAPNWYSHTIIYNHATYISRSVTVINHGSYGRYDHTVAARLFNQRIATRTVVGPHGGTYTDQRVAGDGHYNNSRTVTGPHGATYTDQRSIGNGQYDNTRTVVGPNGRSASKSTSHYAGGSSTTVTGPAGNTGSRTVTGRGTGDATITQTGPRGTKTRTRSRPR